MLSKSRSEDTIPYRRKQPYSKALFHIKTLHFYFLYTIKFTSSSFLLCIRNKNRIFAPNSMVMEVISRSYYTEKIDSWLGSGQIIVLIGQRRVGKSYVMKDFIARHEREADANIIYIDKEKRLFRFIRNCDELDAYIDARLLPDKHNYILIDEVQDIEGWEKSVRSYRTEDNVDILITGSNSKMLSGELGTMLGGRYKPLRWRK